MITSAELASGLVDLKAQVGKVAIEQADRFDVLTAKVAALEALIAAGGSITQEVSDAFDGVKTAVQSLDDVIVDQSTVKK